MINDSQENMKTMVPLEMKMENIEFVETSVEKINLTNILLRPLRLGKLKAREDAVAQEDNETSGGTESP